MANRITSLAVDCTDGPGLARFWTAVLGWQVVDQDEFCLLRSTVDPLPG